jgi:hypothetical protein
MNCETCGQKLPEKPSFKSGLVEFRYGNNVYEIVKWNNQGFATCYTLAFIVYETDEEFWQVELVGNRIFHESINLKDVKKCVDYALQYLEDNTNI